MSTLTRELPQHIQGLAATHGDLRTLQGAPLVAIGSVKFPELTGYDAVRFQDCLAATDAYI